MANLLSYDIEKEVIANVLFDLDSNNNETLKSVLANGITKDDFANPTCRKIFIRMSEKGETTIDLICASCAGNAKDEEVLMQLQSHAGVNWEVPKYCAKLKEYTARRKVAEATVKFADLCGNPEIDLFPELVKLSTLCIEQQNRLEVRESKSQEDLLLDYISDLGEGVCDKDVIRYGLPTDDYAKHRKGEVFTLGAAAGTGKTMFALSAMLNMALEGRKVILFCEEMSFEALNARLIANLGNIPYEDVQEGRVLSPDSRKQAFTSAVGKLKSLYEMNNLRILGSGQYTHSSSGIEAELQKFYNEAGRVDFFCVDYIQRVRPSTVEKDEVGRISAAMSEVTSLAVKFNAAALVLSQLSRSGQQQGGKFGNTALKGSSQIEQDSAIVAMLDFVYAEVGKNNIEPRDDVRRFVVTKARNFQSGKSKDLLFEGKYARFSPHTKF